MFQTEKCPYRDPLRQKMKGQRLEVKEQGLLTYKVAGEAPLLLDVSDVGRDCHVVWKLLEVAVGGQREGSVTALPVLDTAG